MKSDFELASFGVLAPRCADNLLNPRPMVCLPTLPESVKGNPLPCLDRLSSRKFEASPRCQTGTQKNRTIRILRIKWHRFRCIQNSYIWEHNILRRCICIKQLHECFHRFDHEGDPAELTAGFDAFLFVVWISDGSNETRRFDRKK